MRETPILREILIAASSLPTTRLFRNNQGVAVYENGSRVRYGIANPGGSDAIGWHSIEITPEMVGRRLAVFTAVEAKSQTGRLTDDQANFLRRVTEAGGIAGVCRSKDELLHLLTGGRLL